MKYYRVYSVFILAVFIAFSTWSGVQCLLAGETPSRGRSDAIIIDTLAVYGKLEKSPVLFLHDNHTRALNESSASNQSCQSCHINKEGVIYPKFKRLEDIDRITLMNLYHDECISCHGEMERSRQKTGPVDCDDCHQKKRVYQTVHRPVGFDPWLHYRHVETSDNKCEACHHEYDTTQKKLVYLKGREGTCRYCHKGKKIDNKISMGNASHLACVNCHIEKTDNPSTVPPVSCSGCHEAGAVEKMKKIPPPRMTRNQPDFILVRAAVGPTKEKTLGHSIGFVPFNHKHHEDAGISCRRCHHEGWQPCNECHTQDTARGQTSKNITASLIEEKAVLLEKAMHKPDSPRSCMGCHNDEKRVKSCVGCHDAIDISKRPTDEACKKCHTVSNEEMRISLSKETRESMATDFWTTYAQRSPKTAPENVPKTVFINKLSDKYQGVTFPHGIIVKALAKGIKESRLSVYFHTEGSICQGCHHNSPVSEKPPQCASCHTGAWDAANPGRPGIMGAYHQMCIGCHKTMGLRQKTECTECHKMK